jgi:uncharacterized protein
VSALLKIALWTLSAYAIYCLFLLAFQRQVVFPRGMTVIPPEGGKEIRSLEKIRLETGRGSVEAWYLPPVPESGAGAAPAVIFAHGNAELIDHWPETLAPFTRIGIGVLLVEYPGYGRSGGSPSQASITAAFVAAYDHLIARNEIDPSRIVLFGRSLGGGAVCRLAAERPTAAIILMSTFTGIRAFALRHGIPPFLILDPFDNLSVVSSYYKPVLVIHGKKDTIVPFSHGVALSKAGRHSRLLAYDCGHNDCPPDWNQFWKDIEGFLHYAGIVEKNKGN